MPVNVVSYAPPNGNIAPTFNHGRFSAPFAATAEFGGAPLGNGEYRQYVKGRFVAAGSVVTHYLCGANALAVAVYKEDELNITPCVSYGHRVCPNPIDQYLATRANGNRYSMTDDPGFSNLQAGVTYQVELSFKGDLIDTTAPAPPMRTATWTVNGQGAAPAAVSTTTASTPARGLQPEDRLVGAHYSKNLDTGADEVHIVIKRHKNAPAIEPSLTSFVLKSAEGVPITPSKVLVHEVGNEHGSTASIVHTLDPSEPRPASIDHHEIDTVRIAPNP
jgi:hypothetical protein